MSNIFYSKYLTSFADYKNLFFGGNVGDLLTYTESCKTYILIISGVNDNKPIKEMENKIFNDVNKKVIENAVRRVTSWREPYGPWIYQKTKFPWDLNVEDLQKISQSYLDNPNNIDKVFTYRQTNEASSVVRSVIVMDKQLYEDTIERESQFKSIVEGKRKGAIKTLLDRILFQHELAGPEEEEKKMKEDIPLDDEDVLVKYKDIKIYCIKYTRLK